ncbi:uncharacterized protein [Diadema antillarum]|uniref:uncharacterized protein n=1 Tax=Diadema antillarum TaxID=105358 RepID=UPI003A87BFAC
MAGEDTTELLVLFKEIDEMFEHFATCSDVVTVDCTSYLRKLDSLTMKLKEWDLSDDVTNYLTDIRDFTIIFKKCWNALVEEGFPTQSAPDENAAQGKQASAGENIEGGDKVKINEENRCRGTEDDERTKEMIDGNKCEEREEKDDVPKSDTSELVMGMARSSETMLPASAPSNLSLDFLSILLTCCVNLTDYSANFCRRFEDSGCLKFLFSVLTPKNLENKLVSSVITIIYNCCWRVPEVSACCVDIIEPLQTFTESPNPEIQAESFLSLAYIVKESETHRIALNRSCVQFLLKVLADCLNDLGHLGYSLLEIAMGINQLAINDNNKRVIVDLGGHVLLERLLDEESSSEDEKMFAARAIWRLSFVEANRALMTHTQSLCDVLQKIKTETTNDALQQTCTGALFVLNNMETSISGDAQEQQPEKEEGEIVDLTIEGGLHVMISYQWASQSILLKVKDFLQKNGYRVWMDIDCMKGDILDAMAKAVQQSAVVLVGMTRKYKESQNCRTEATYAYTLNKDIIPLKLQDGYSPDVWLGALCGMKKYVSLCSEADLDEGLQELVAELGPRGELGRSSEDLENRGENEILDSPSIHSMVSRDSIEATVSLNLDSIPMPLDTVDGASTPRQGSGHSHGSRKPSHPQSGVSMWSRQDTGSWLKSMGIDATNDRIRKLDGTRLVQIFGLLNRAPEYCVTSLNRELGMSFWDVLTFVDELEKMFA